MKINQGQEVRGERREAEIFPLWCRVITFCCLLLLVSCQVVIKPQGLEVKVLRVVSGQSLEAIDTGKQPEMVSISPQSSIKVRLVGVDAPDLQQQPWGQAAKERLQAMIGSKPVLLEFDVQNKDAFGRQLAYVWQDRLLLNELLVKEGCVLFVPRSPNQKYDQRLERAQEWARLMGLGIWNPSQPMRLTPAEFRKSRD